MRKQLAKAKRARAKAAGTEVDHQVAEFESHDLGDDIPAAGAFKVLRRGKSMPTSIVLQPELVAKLKKKAEHRGIGYGSKNDAYAVFRGMSQA